MRNRRTVLCSVLGTLALPWTAVRAATATPANQAPPGTPVATVVPGKPPILDFGDGVRVPCNKQAFLSLWEGKTYWLTFGAGRAHDHYQAQGQAVKYAKAAMKLLLMTMAFTPERLDQIDGGGWRLKSDDIKSFVKGDIDLPGEPFWPNTDAFMGFGASDAPALGSLGFGGLSPSGVGGGQDILTGSWLYVDAFSAYVVFKKDVSLQYVRSHAQVLPFG